MQLQADWQSCSPVKDKGSLFCHGGKCGSCGKHHPKSACVVCYRFSICFQDVSISVRVETVVGEPPDIFQSGRKLPSHKKSDLFLGHSLKRADFNKVGLIHLEGFMQNQIDAHENYCKVKLRSEKKFFPESRVLFSKIRLRNYARKFSNDRESRYMGGNRGFFGYSLKNMLHIVISWTVV